MFSIKTLRIFLQNALTPCRNSVAIQLPALGQMGLLLPAKMQTLKRAGILRQTPPPQSLKAGQKSSLNKLFSGQLLLCSFLYFLFGQPTLACTAGYNSQKGSIARTAPKGIGIIKSGSYGMYCPDIAQMLYLCIHWQFYTNFIGRIPYPPDFCCTELFALNSVSPSRFERAVYDILRNLIEIVFLLCLLCFQNLLRLRSQILKRVILFV